MPAGDDEPSLIDSAGRVAGDFACLACGYNLRTLPSAGVCPECGTRVGRSLRGDRLSHSDRAWLASISRALALLVVTIAAIVAVTILDVVLFPLPGAGSAVGIAERLRIAIEILSRVMLSSGVWVFTYAEPGGVRSGRSRAIRISLRVLAAIQVLTPLARSIIVIRLAIQEAAFVAANVGCMVLVLVYVRHLAERVPDREAMRSARRLLAGLAGAVLLMVFGVVAEWMWPSRYRPTALMAMGVAASVALAFPIILLLGRFQRVLSRIAAEARKPPKPVAEDGPA